MNRGCTVRICLIFLSDYCTIGYYNVHLSRWSSDISTAKRDEWNRVKLLKRRKDIGLYKTVGIQTSVTEADPHRLVQLLFENLIASLNRAKGAIDNREVMLKAKEIDRSIQMVGALRFSLDFERGGELSERLAGLYDYMMQRLVVANINSSSEIVDECLALVKTIKGGWDQIPELLKQQIAER